MAAAMVTLLPFYTASAQSEDDDKLSLNLGLFVTDRDSETRIDARAGIPDGTEVDLEGELGLDTSDSVFRLDGAYRFNERHRIDFSWFDLSRTGSKTIEREIDWNETTFPISAMIDSNFDLGIYKLAYTWSAWRQEKGFLGITAGLYVADIQTSLSARLIDAREVAAFTAPLPVFGLRGEYQLSENWTFRGSGEFFFFEYGDFDGSLYDLYVGADYQLFDSMAIGVGANSVRMNLGVTKRVISGDIDWRYDGGLIYFKFDF